MSKNKTKLAVKTPANNPELEKKQSSIQVLYAWCNKLLPFVFAAYVLAVIVGVINHESWGDEAQSWLLVKDLGLADLFRTLPSEGHPPLWYLVLYPFAKLGFPYECVKWIAAIIMMASIFLLFFKTKVNVLLKLALPFSYYYLYLYCVFGRSYPLISFITVCLVILYPKRFQRPWLFALCMIGLFNTHMLYFSFAFSLACLYILDAYHYKQLNKQVVGAFILMMMGGLYLIPFFNSSDIVEYSQHVITDHSKNIKIVLENGIITSNVPAIVGGTILLALLVSLINRPKVLLLLAGGIAGLFYIVAFRYNFIQARHYGVLVLIITGAFFFADYYKDDKWNISFKNQVDLARYGFMLWAFVLIGQISSGIRAFNLDNDNQFSGAKEAAEFIMDNQLDKETLIAYVPYAAVSIVPYLPDSARLFDAGCHRYYRHYVYDDCFTHADTVKPGDVATVAWYEFQQKGKKAFLVLNGEVDLRTIPYFDLVYQSPASLLYPQESFYIYKFKDSMK